MPINGVKQVNRRIASTLNKIGGEITRKTMIQVMMTGQNHSLELTPVDTSNLINSRFMQVQNVSDGFRGLVGYTANYARFVHDGGPKDWQKIGAEDNFLRKGFDENMPELIQIIKNGHKI